MTTAFFPGKGELPAGQCPNCNIRTYTWTGNDDEVKCNCCGETYHFYGFCVEGKIKQGGESMTEQKAISSEPLWNELAEKACQAKESLDKAFEDLELIKWKIRRAQYDLQEISIYCDHKATVKEGGANE